MAPATGAHHTGRLYQRASSHQPLLSKLQRMLNLWQTLPPSERPMDQHPVKRPPLPPASRRTEPPSNSSAQAPTTVGPKRALPKTRSRRIDGLAVSAMHGLLQQLSQWLQHDDNYNRRDALNIMSDLPSSWPSCRLCINADTVATSYLAGLHRLFQNSQRRTIRRHCRKRMHEH